MENSLYYLPSGRLPSRVMTLTLACAAIVTIPAWLYAWITIAAPLVVVDWFALFGFALLMGLAMAGVARLGKARNPVWMGRLGLGLGTIGWYAQWAAWVALSRSAGEATGSGVIDFVSLLGDPQQVYLSALALSDGQRRNVAGVDLDGGVLVAVWIVELVVLLAVPRMLAYWAAEEPFCEQTDRWTTVVELPRKFAFIEAPDAIIARLERHPDQLFSILEANPDEDPERFAVVALHRGGGDPYVSINNVQIERRGKNAKKTERIVVRHLRVPGADADQLIASAGADVQAAPNPPELIDAIDHLEAGRFDAALADAMVHTEASQDSLRIDALRLCALASARLERWQASLDYWKRLFDEEPNALNALQVGSSYAMTGEAAHGQAWVAEARELNAGTGDMPDLQILTNFISALTQSSQMKQALPYLEEVRAVYTSLGITDPTFLFIRKIPFLGAFLDNSLPVVRGVLDRDEGRAWYAAMLPSLDQEGRDTLNGWLEQHFAATTAVDPA